VKNKEVEEALSRYPNDTIDSIKILLPVFYHSKASKFWSRNIKVTLRDNKELDIKEVY